MNTLRFALSSCTAALLVFAASSTLAADVKLAGDQEVPAVKTSASGTGNISVAADGTVSGSVMTTGLNGTAAHIHHGAAGKNGPVVVPLTKSADGNTWSVPAGSKLNADQLKAYQAGELYVNVHTEANKGGEIRAQIKP
ncbi:CHRD domain-containing protein [Ideonella sp. YS5]|uniref:CHRD domain-containing protein n=1 Tax=Ideonella sp. YS5 TaxID=3453714 RepID=UPI003EEF8C19